MNISSPKTPAETPFIYHRAVSGYPGMIDFVDFFGQQQAALCIGQLLKNKPYEETVHCSIPEVRPLFFQSRNAEKQSGLASLGLGYPLINFIHNRQLISAPLLIWPVQLYPHPQDPGQWRFHFHPSHHIQINPFLLHHWQNFYGWNYQEILNNYKTYPGLLQKTVNELLGLLEKEFAKQQPDNPMIHQHPPFSMNPLPTVEEIDATAHQLAISWSAVLGYFPPVFTHLPIQIALLKKENMQRPDSPFGISALTPEQDSALTIIRQYRSCVINGDDQQRLALVRHLLSNAPSNGRTTLVVSAQLHQLQEIQEVLTADQLDKHTFLFRNTAADWALLHQLITQKAEDKNYRSFDNASFENLQSNLIKQHQELHQTYQSTQEIVFQDRNFQETVGYFLHHQKQEGRELLNSQLEADDFSFSDAEYQELCKAIETASPLFQKVNTLNHPLEMLQPSIFTENEEAEATQKLRSKLSAAEEELTQLQHRYLSATDQYRDQLSGYYDNISRQLSDTLQQLEIKMKQYSQQHGIDFQLTSLASLKLISRFSNKYKTILQAKQEVIGLFRKLHQDYQQNAYFDFSFTAEGEKRNIARWSTDMEAFREALKTWQAQIPSQIKTEMLRLSPGNSKEKIGMSEEIRSLETALEEALGRLNKASLFQEQFRNVMLTTEKQRQYLGAVIGKIEQAQAFLRDFSDYFRWKKCWLSLSPTARSLIKALISAKPRNWMTAYKSWFLHHRLRKACNDRLPEHTPPIAEFAGQLAALQQQMPKQIQALWANRMNRSIKQWKTEDKLSYQQFFTDQHGLEGLSPYVNLFRQHIELVSTRFPVFLTTPFAALNLTGKSSAPPFDNVLILDGAMEGLQQAQAALQLGKKVVILGEETQQVLNPHQQPLWQYLNELPSYALSSGRTTSADSSESTVKTEQLSFISTNGIFDEDQEINATEALETLQVLQQLPPTPQQTYPRVHILCMTQAQRDLLYSHFLDIKQKNMPEKEKIQHLERNGLSVFSIDEVPLPPADVLIFNHTFGPVRGQGGLSEKTQRLQKPRFKEQLKMVLKKPFQQVVLINSIPMNDLRKLAQSDEGLASYFGSFPQEISHQLFDSPQPFIEAPKAPQQPSAELYFVKEVSDQLKPLLAAHRLKLYKESMPSSKILLVASEEEPIRRAAILPDGFFSESPSTHMLWEYNQQTHYINKGIALIPIWSVLWWKDQEAEAQKLIDALVGILKK